MHSVALLGAMVFQLSLLGWIFAGADGLIWALLISIGLLIIGPGISPRLVLRLYGAKPLSPQRAPGLYAIVRDLAAQAALSRIPMLYYVPSEAMNAFAAGSRNNAAIAVTDGLLKTLDTREINAVLAHEISHLRHNDLWILNISNIVGRVTALFSLTGQVLLLLNLPLWLVSGLHISWLAILVLIMAPTITTLLQLALSRTREFNADLSAAELTGDPRGLATALLKIDRRNAGLLSRILVPGYSSRQPSILRTHPHTGERVNRLLKLSEENPAMPSSRRDRNAADPPHIPAIQVHRHPNWRHCGIWC